MLEPELAGVSLGREQRLKKVLSRYSNEYDFCIVDCPPSLGVAGILFAKHHPEQCNARMSRELAGMIAERMGAKVFNSFIREAVEVEDAHNEAKTIGERSPDAKPSLDYAAFVDELLGEMGE